MIIFRFRNFFIYSRGIKSNTLNPPIRVLRVLLLILERETVMHHLIFHQFFGRFVSECQF